VFSKHTLLIKAKNVFYDQEYLYVEKKDELQKIPLNLIIKIKRTFYYFYTIYIDNKNFMKESKIIYLISPNPNPWRDEKVKELLGFAEEARNEKANPIIAT
jgi:hypothetical protein